MNVINHSFASTLMVSIKVTCTFPVFSSILLPIQATAFGSCKCPDAVYGVHACMLARPVILGKGTDVMTP